MSCSPTPQGRRNFLHYKTAAVQQVNPREGPGLATAVTSQFCGSINGPETAAEQERRKKYQHVATAQNDYIIYCRSSTNLITLNGLDQIGVLLPETVLLNTQLNILSRFFGRLLAQTSQSISTKQNRGYKNTLPRTGPFRATAKGVENNNTSQDKTSHTTGNMPLPYGR